MTTNVKWVKRFRNLEEVSQTLGHNVSTIESWSSEERDPIRRSSPGDDQERDDPQNSSSNLQKSKEQSNPRRHWQIQGYNSLLAIMIGLFPNVRS